MRVIFWDIDGVLNTPDNWGRWSDIHGEPKPPLTTALVERAAALTHSLEAHCVLSSTWRDHFGSSIAALRKKGWQHVRHDFVGATGQGASRGEEILAWLAEHPEYTEYVVIDDDGFDLDGVRHRWVEIDHTVGLTDQNCQDVRRLFQRKDGV